MTQDPDFKGYIHDVGGPTANFRHPCLRKAAETRGLPEQAVSVPEALSESEGGSQRLYLPSAEASGYPQRKESVHPFRHPV